MQIDQLRQFAVSDSDALLIDGKFGVALTDCRLGEVTLVECRAKLLALSGCFLWVMRVEGNRYKIYLGQTRSIHQRVADYSVGFQIHSPNDFKMRFFEEAMRQDFPQASLDLYFAITPPDDCLKRETELVRQLRPLVNTLPTANQRERDLIRDAFRCVLPVDRRPAPRQ